MIRIIDKILFWISISISLYSMFFIVRGSLINYIAISTSLYLSLRLFVGGLLALPKAFSWETLAYVFIKLISDRFVDFNESNPCDFTNDRRFISGRIFEMFLGLLFFIEAVYLIYP